MSPRSSMAMLALALLGTGAALRPALAQREDDARVQHVLQQMTLAEKLSLIRG